MENQTKVNIGTGAIITLLLSFVLIGNIEPTHYCMDREIKMYCSELSQYYGLENGKCYNPSGNKLCKSGWEEIPFMKEELNFNYDNNNKIRIHCDNKICK